MKKQLAAILTFSLILVLIANPLSVAAISDGLTASSNASLFFNGSDP